MRAFLCLLGIALLFSCQSSSDSDLIKWVTVPGGSFQMGGNLSTTSTLMDLPEHEVTISTFDMSATEVTVGMYRSYCEATNQTLPPPPPWGWKDSLPMVNITWQQAQDFCSWAGGRLPTEAEWEYAARGGNQQEDFVAEQLQTSAWIQENADDQLQPVGQKSPNSLGLYDMMGNAAEWCQDWYQADFYNRSPGENPTGPEQGQFRVIRGGHFRHPGGWVHRPEVRFQGAPLQAKETVGFRVVRN